MNNQINSSIIVSVYSDQQALQLIFDCLAQQTVNNFEIIISEDGENADIKKVVEANDSIGNPVMHLTQTNAGFRKNIALNRAIMAAQTDHLVFIDGDCLPHPGFIAAHQAFAQQGIACTGRRLELGEKISKRIRDGSFDLTGLTRPLLFIRNSPALQLDYAKNIESGIHSSFLHRLTRNKSIRILGCNLSCHKQDLIKINGFNEDYLAAGIGEDSDIDWRLRASGVAIKNVKFSANQYHLYHKRTYSPSEENQNIYRKTKEANQFICTNGLKKL